MIDQEAVFHCYVKELKSVAGVRVAKEEDKNRLFYSFTSNAENALAVTLYLHKGEGAFVGIEIEGADTSYWNTAEEEDLDYFMMLAHAALAGEVSYNKSPLFRFKEVCFRLEDGWHCTRAACDNASYHYTKVRKRIKTHKDR